MITELLLKFCITYLLGAIFLAPFPLWRQQSALVVCFFRLAAGSLGVASLWAVYFTNFKTILVLFPVLYTLSLLAYSEFKSIRLLQLLRKQDLKILGIHLLALLAGLGIQCYRHAYFDPDTVSFLDVDFGIYTTAAEYLMQTGLEMPSPWYAATAQPLQMLQPQPYHYGDLWYAAFCIYPISGIPPLYQYLLVFLPIVMTLTFSSLALLVQLGLGQKQLASPFWWVLCFLLVFYGIYIVDQPQLARGLLFNSLTVPKTIALYPAFAAFAFFWLRHQRLSAVACLAIIPILNILYLPALISAAALFFVWQVFRYSNQPYHRQIYILFLPAIASLYIWFFYNTVGSFFIGIVPEQMRIQSYLFRVFRGVVSGGLRTLIFHCLWLLPIYWLYRKQHFLKRSHLEVLGMGVFLLIGGLAGKALLNNRPSEADQLFYVVATPIIVLTGSYCLGLLKSLWIFSGRFSRWQKAFLLLLATVPFLLFVFVFPTPFDRVSRSFISEVSNSLADKNKIGAYLPDPEQFNVYTYDPRMCLFGYFIKISGRDYWVNSLAVPETLEQLEFPERANAVSISPFFRFIQQQKTTGQWRGYTQAQLEFINSEKVDFLLLEKGVVIPQSLTDCVEKMITDPQSGHQILMLNRPCVY